MIPTNRLRWIERKISLATDEHGQDLPPGIGRPVTIKVLQQLWQHPDYADWQGHGQWRDVPLEAE